MIGSAANAAAVLYEQTTGPDFTSTVPSKVSIKPGETSYTLSVSSAFDMRYDVSYPTYVSTIDGKKTDWSNLSAGQHTVTQHFEYKKYTSTSADCYVAYWHDGYADVESSMYSIECKTAWGDIEASDVFDWYERPYVMSLYGMVGSQFAVTTRPDGKYGRWFISVARDAKLAYGKTFTGMLVSQDSPQSATMDLTTTVLVERSLSATEPTISSSTPKVGQTLTLAPGSWGPAGVRLTYQWMADGNPIPGATATTLNLAAAQMGMSITVAVTGSLDGYATTTLTSRPTDKVAGLKLSATPKPKITGTAKVGKKLTAKPGTWKPSKVALTYQWYAKGAAIQGATSKSYKLTKSEKGKKITVTVSGAKAGYASVARTSKATKAVRK